MTGSGVFITGMGVACPAGYGVEALFSSIRKPHSLFSLLSRFPTLPENRLPVGEAPDPPGGDLPPGYPLTHQLALKAAEEAMSRSAGPPDAVVLGGTTGGMALTEDAWIRGDASPSAYVHHATGSVADAVARFSGCTGPVITLSTACSSGTAALHVAWAMIRNGSARRVLCGGADALCRLTYYGFKSLQLIDPDGARPLDKDRKGLSLSDGAALLLLEGSESPPEGAMAEIRGAGLSCDAHHPTAPHPEGTGARAAMERALKAAGISPSEVDYINLHGTGTPDNDRSEALAVRKVFGGNPPALSSVKGALGHSLAAAGAVEAVVSALAIAHGILPANSGCAHPDPSLELFPVMEPRRAVIRTVLSNSFGFGGNNAAIVFSAPCGRPSRKSSAALPIRILGSSCITGAGTLKKTLETLASGRSAAGVLPDKDLGTPPDIPGLRRMKRLPRLALALAEEARRDAGSPPPASVFWGTGWGPLSETHDFLTRLFATGSRFPSPTDFMGSVHNSPAGQIALYFRATGPNLTVTGGDHSFEQALWAAALIADPPEEPFFLAAADEFHPRFSPRLTPREALTPADGGAGFILDRTDTGSGARLLPLAFQPGFTDGDGLSQLIRSLGGTDGISRNFGAVFIGVSPSPPGTGGILLEKWKREAPAGLPMVSYRDYLGEHASASAAAAAVAARYVADGCMPVPLCGEHDGGLNGKGVLMLGFGRYITAVGVMP